jgi:hypothetical protein
MVLQNAGSMLHMVVETNAVKFAVKASTTSLPTLSHNTTPRNELGFSKRFALISAWRQVQLSRHG